MSYPPPPPFEAVPDEKPTAGVWLIPVAAVLAVVGAVTPWFTPVVSVTFGATTKSVSAENAVYSWRDGRVGLLAPLLLVILAVGVVAMMTGRRVGRFHANARGPVPAAARAAMVSGAVSLISTGAAWLMLSTQYEFPVDGVTYSWNGFIALLEQHGGRDVQISHGPQIGYWLTVAAGLLSILGGFLMLAVRRRPVRAGAPTGFPPPGAPLQSYPPLPGYQPMPNYQPGPVHADAPAQLAYQGPPPTVPPGYQSPSATPGAVREDDGSPSIPMLKMPGTSFAPPPGPQ